MKDWLTQNRPEAIIGFNNYVIGALDWAMGWKVPEHVAFIDLHLETTDTFMTGMENMTLKTTCAAVELIDQQIRHRLRGIPEAPRTLALNPHWIPGHSLPIRSMRQ